MNAGALRDPIAAAGATITNVQNIDLFQDGSGGWHAAVTIGVHTLAHPKHWTVIAHAHPAEPATPGSPPLAWSADTLLSGSFSDPVEGNYDAKYYEDEGRLYPALRGQHRPAAGLAEHDRHPGHAVADPAGRLRPGHAARAR